LDALEGFVSSGLRASDGMVVIATPAHRRALEQRLRKRGFDVDLAQAEDRYIALDAAETLAKFMVNGWPDDERFNQVVTDLITRARGNGRRVRAFGEMVALLWDQGNSGATVRLEVLWNKFCEAETFCLFCAYPETGFTKETPVSINEICGHHSRLINV
jgi:hypothetical protein